MDVTIYTWPNNCNKVIKYPPSQENMDYLSDDLCRKMDFDEVGMEVGKCLLTIYNRLLDYLK